MSDDNGLKVQLTPGLTAAEAAIKASGEQVDLLTQDAADRWGIGWPWIQGVLHGWSALMGQSRVPIRLEDPWNNASDDYHDVWLDLTKPTVWQGYKSGPRARAVLTPVDARILQIVSKPVIMDRQIFDNRNAGAPAEFEAEISDKVTKSVENSWSTQFDIGVSRTISVEVGSEAAGGSVKTDTTLSFNASWGHEGSTSTEIEVGSGARIRQTLDPGQLELAVLIASRGQLTAQVTWQTLADGYVRVRWGNEHHGGYHHPFILKGSDGQYHKCWTTLVSVQQLMDFADMKRDFRTSQLLKTGYFADGSEGAYKIANTDPDTIEKAPFGGVDPEKVTVHVNDPLPL